MKQMKKIKVLIVDDSAVVRKSLTKLLSSDNKIEVIGCAPDPLVAVTKMAKQAPDVILLDVEMPRMNGIIFLRKIMEQHPLPVIICSSFVSQGSDVFDKALEYGAVGVVLKPNLGSQEQLHEAQILLTDAVKAAALTKPPKLTLSRLKSRGAKLDADVVLAKTSTNKTFTATEKIIVVGASTGGTEALTVFLAGLPHDFPGVVVVQHMPKGFTNSFARRLDGLCAMSVKEAEKGDDIVCGRILIAPGNKHTLCKRNGKHYYVDVIDGELVSRHRPSVDVLFRSAARYAGNNAFAVIMTGMGDDGAKGMKEMHTMGARTIAQDQASSVVFGMPRVAIELGGVDKIVPLDNIAQELTNFLKR